MQLTIPHTIVLISRPVPQAAPANEINAQTLAAHFFGDIQRKIVRLEGDLCLRLLKILDFKGEDAIHKRFRFAAASSENPGLRRRAAFAGPLTPAIWASLAQDIDYRTRFAVLHDPRAVKVLSNWSLAAAVKGDITAAQMLLKSLAANGCEPRHMEKLMTEVDLSGNKTFRLQLKRLLSKGLWGSSSFTLDDDVEPRAAVVHHGAEFVEHLPAIVAADDARQLSLLRCALQSIAQPRGEDLLAVRAQQRDVRDDHLPRDPKALGQLRRAQTCVAPGQQAQDALAPRSSVHPPRLLVLPLL